MNKRDCIIIVVICVFFAGIMYGTTYIMQPSKNITDQQVNICRAVKAGYTVYLDDKEVSVKNLNQSELNNYLQNNIANAQIDDEKEEINLESNGAASKSMSTAIRIESLFALLSLVVLFAVKLATKKHKRKKRKL